MTDTPLDRHASTWDLDDLLWILDQKPEESDRLDYKQVTDPSGDDRGPYSTPSQRKEVAKDISSFANTSGGRMIIGMSEDRVADRNRPSALDPFPASDTQAADRLVTAVHDLCRPPISLRPNRVEVPEGGFCLVVEIPESLTPVMLQGTGENRFYWRQDDHSVPMTEQQVRERYERMLTAREALAKMAAEAETGQPTSHPGTECAWFTLLVMPALGPIAAFDPADTRVPKHLQLAQFAAVPTKSGFRWLHEHRPAYFGLDYSSFYTIDYPAGTLRIQLKLHRTGLIEAHAPQYTAAASGHAPINLPQLASCLLDGLRIAAELYKMEGYVSDVEVVATVPRLAGFSAQGSGLHTPSGVSYEMRSNVLTLADDAESLLRGFLNRIWNGAGFTRCDLPSDWLQRLDPVFGLMQ